MTSDDASFVATDSPTARAIAASMLAGLPSPLRRRVLADALLVDLPAGSTIYRDEDDPRCILVVTGLVRVVLSAPDGRTLTVAYARAGELLGVATIVVGPAPVSAQMVSDAQLLMLSARTLAYLGQTEPAVGWMLAREVARRLYDTINAVADTGFGSLRQHVARHLLDLAIAQQDGRLVAVVTQQELAETVGSARPAVARVVAELRELGLIATASPGIAILDAEGLHGQTWSGSVSHLLRSDVHK
jgi:CRP/FNR family cyclic AMP-dependent transcriptional regulator